jgi:spermidine/putrescine transport system permease protein
MKRFLELDRLYFWGVVFFLYLPIGLLVVFSFNDSTILVFPLRGFTLQWYEEMLGATQLLDSLRNSLVLGVGSALVSMLAGALAAVAVMRFDFRGKRLFLAMASMPLVVPYVVIGVALLIVIRTLDVPLSLLTAGLGHVIVSLPVSLLVISARLADFPRNIEEAAADLGANYWQTLLRITLPISLPALAAAFLISFTISFNEFMVTFFLTSTETTLPVYIFSQLRNTARLPVTVTITAVIMVVSVVLLLTAERLAGVGRGKED